LSEQSSRQVYEYIVVGSGAGGGVVAARLAQAGRKVLLIEAGGDYQDLQGGGPVTPTASRLPEDYEVPSFHPMASENFALKWDFFVRHYSDLAQQQKDKKFCKEHDGVLYPRASTLGGCTAHNAMIMVYPHNADWDHIAVLTGDPSWRPKNMRRYFSRLENCRHRWPYRLLYRLTGLNPTRHGFGGWLSIEKAIPKAVLGDKNLIKVVGRAAWASFWELADWWKRITWALQSQGDPNDWRLVRRNSVGVHYAPIHTHRHARNSTREFLLDVRNCYPDRLAIELNTLVTRVLFDESNRALGVVVRKGAKLYRACHEPTRDGPNIEHEVYASREVILAGGAFNTPQLLMLSGIGPKAELEKHRIAVRVDLPGVGSNLQDRYEVGVVNRMKQDWEVLQKAKFTRDDPQCRQWSRWGRGVYTTNGAALAVIKRSFPTPARPLPDLFVFALLGRFEGYFPGYSKLIAEHQNYLTWCILKAHTNNRGGTVELASADPCDPPRINFHYFDEGTDTKGEDLDSVVQGIEFVRTLTAVVQELIDEEEKPGSTANDKNALKQFVKNNAWGHHASCTCPIGPASDRMAVLDNNFQVYGTSNLRVVDASVFPRIPGFFIVSAVYMIAEKASDVILAAAGQAEVPYCIYGQSVWCRLWTKLVWLGSGLPVLALWLGSVVRIVVALLVLLLGVSAVIAGASWYVFEPPSEKADLNAEEETVRATVDVMRQTLIKQSADTVRLRAEHPKTDACVKANVTIDDDLPSDLQVGFLKGKSYKAWIRFSNAAARATDDGEPDFRGMAVKMFGVSGERLPNPGDESDTQDLLFNGNETFVAGNARQFHDFVAACAKGGSCDPLSNPFVIWHFVTHPRGAWNFLTGRRAYPSIADINWYSTVAFDLGDENHLAKYSAVPAEPQAQFGAPGSTAYYLQQRLEDRLDPTNNNHLILNLQIQTRTDPASEPIENALVRWTSPWRKVATIDIYPQVFATTAQHQFCERLTFNPWHGLKVHMPRGGINRAARDVMSELQDVRLRANGLKRFAPGELTGDENPTDNTSK
jgi:choline dehydrogenase